jgi:sterol desaturase/sphingolipid hydroxylase (fatty acid hydroxylase superfamily)
MQIVIAVALIILFFVCLERLFPLHRQKIFRVGWVTDLLHYFMNQYLVDVGVFLLAIPLYVALWWAIDNPLAKAIAAQRPMVQFLEALIVAELAFYWVHRAAHTYPWLWRFHVIHHSSEQLDFLAAVRFHPMEMAIVRVGVGLPLVLLGFSVNTFGGYLFWNVLNSIFVHSNIRWKIPIWLWWLLTPPRYHHWHHVKEVIDKNFGHPFLDGLFGTFYYPKRDLPMDYGVPEVVPNNYLQQLLLPFRNQKANRANHPGN